jgi:glycosyltransferase involved in cell wall biosynthesis
VTSRSDLLPISVFIITKNEEKRLSVTLSAVADFANEVVVVDSGSTDRTVAVAQAFGAKVLETHWRGYGPQKRFAEEQCSNNWVLNLDSDEELTPELRAEIASLFLGGEPPLDGYAFPILEVLPTWSTPGILPHTVTPVRLYRLDRGRYADSLVHDRVAMSDGSKTGQLHHHANHFSMVTLSQVVRKLNDYSDLQVRDMLLRKRRISALRLWTEFPLAFLKSYIVRRHFLRGSAGLIASVNYAFFRLLRIAKALEDRSWSS